MGHKEIDAIHQHLNSKSRGRTCSRPSPLVYGWVATW